MKTPKLLAIAILSALILTGCGAAGDTQAAGFLDWFKPKASTSAGGAATARPAQIAAARTQLAGIPAKGRAPKTGYTRARFGQAWADVDHNGCDTRNDILKRDMTGERFAPGTHNCVVASGTLADPYTARTITFTRGARTSSAVQIDHLVPLSDAWQKGAQGWTTAKRTQLANDPNNLLAVDGHSNTAKSDKDLATWLPANRGYWCTYTAKIVAVKAQYGLWMTSAEKARAAAILKGC
ncbi:HNH endonuclease family protein [Tersicoccus sp. MR15.9]|uniref:HNH endonuclease family protein n=1 Tax=Tersicoccus mangrovi TaxID=3121635 RepID=UPI002FE657CA